jgi:hypothetical protein
MTSLGGIVPVQECFSKFPDLRSLTFGLSRVLNEYGVTVRNVTVLDRQPNIFASSYPSEIVTCRMPDGRTVQMFCKYEPDEEKKTYPNRGNLDYESEVYRNVLLPLGVSSPGFYGLHKDEKTGAKWMFLEYLDQAVRLHKFGLTLSENSAAVIQAAHWIGRFHAASETYLQKISRTSLIVYDEEYYLGWARRTLLFAGPLLRRFGWLPSLCERYSQMATLLPTKPQTVVHGEYYPKNILFQGGIIRPVDWQSAAIAVGEIDLAFLTDRWAHDIVQECELEYQRTRWPERVPEDFNQILRLAHLYQQFLWLGDRPVRTVDENQAWRFDRLRTEGERMGLI